jgi:heptaprenyl diphosphate synthase
MKRKNVRRLTFSALGLAAAIMLQLIEGMFQIPIPVPGVKLGLANIVAIILLVKVG